jgi:spermidine synthase
VLGGLFNTLLAPLAFTGIVEYPLAIVAACLVRPWPAGSTDRRVSRGDFIRPALIGVLTLAAVYALRAQAVTWAVFVVSLTLLAIGCFSFSRRPLRFGLAAAAMLTATQFSPRDAQTLLLADRTFFGVLRVHADSAADRHILLHGSTVHGEQSSRADRRREPLTYYHRSGPIGQVMDALAPRLAAARIGVVGLGAGSLAAYAAPGQRWTFYEIDPAVARIARDPAAFTYLEDCAAACEVVLGDARLSLAGSAATYALIVLDAFSSDGIPVHLLTSEALDLYLRRLTADGVIAFHISNRHLDLKPILAALAQRRGLTALVQRHIVSESEKAEGRYGSEWLLMARSRDSFGSLAADSRWQAPLVRQATRVWTDDFSDVLAVLKTNWAEE